VVGAFQFIGVRHRLLIVCIAACGAALAANGALSAPQASDKEIIDSPLSKPAPEYPERALFANVEGVVRISVTVAPDGRVINAVVIAAAPEGWFEKSALAAIRKWKYRPPRREITFEVAIEFKLP